MYFFRLKTLLAELQAEPANDSRTFKYFFVLTVIIAAQVIYNIARPIHFSFSTICILIAASLVRLIGIITCYFVNGGKNGKYFFHRTFPIGWVLLLRIALPLAVLLYLLAPVILNILGVNLVALSQKQINIINSTEALIVTIIYWWFIAKNVKFLANNAL